MENVDKETGEIMIEPKETATIVTFKREDGSVFWGQDFTGCISKTEPHHAKETDINYLVAKYKPDELAAYLIARNPREPFFHDFSMEPGPQEARDLQYKIKSHFNKLPERLQQFFGTALEYLKFVDNPDNMSALKQLGLSKQNQEKQNNEKTQINDNQKIPEKTSEAKT